MIKAGAKGKIYSLYEIAVILFYASVIAFVPFVLVVTYLFDLDRLLNIDDFILALVIADGVGAIVGTIVLLVKKDALRRRVKPAYRSEFVYLMFIAAFAVLGFVVFYDYLGGDRAYIANFLVVISALLVYVLINLGRKFFKFDYMKK
jgi:hypothetical protein